MKYLTTYKLFESNEDIIDDLRDIFIDYNDDSLSVSFHKLNPNRHLSSYHTQLHNRADYKIIIDFDQNNIEDYDDESYYGKNVNVSLVELIERSIDYMDSIGYDYKVGYGWDGDTYTDGGVDLEDDLENIYDYTIEGSFLNTTFIGIYFFKKEENIQENKFDDVLKLTDDMHEVKRNITDIFYDLNDIGFDIYISSHSHNTYEWTHQIRIKKENDSSFSFDEVKETIERFIDYVDPYVGVLNSFPGRKPIEFRIDHYKWSLHERLKYNLSYDEMLKVVDKDDKASAAWVDGEHVTPTLGDNLRTIYIEIGIKLN